jgi:erythromycin esterase-like protein
VNGYWANEEVVALAEWLRDRNLGRDEEHQIGFYGLDVYSLWDSLHEVLRYLQERWPDAVPAARRALRCFEPYGEDAQDYARATALVPLTCEEEVVALLRGVMGRGRRYDRDGREGHFAAEQNALVAKNAERYYRTMVRGGPHSWNVRDRHMAETLDRLLDFHGPDAKGIVWEHNTHIGDARSTDMAAAGMVNIGQLARERHESEGVVLVGFGSHRGSVIAGQEWGAPMEEMTVPPGREGSWEDVLHAASPADQLLIIGDQTATQEFHARRGHRAIGVVYHPDYEGYGNYVPTVLPGRYDAFLFIDHSHALRPLHVPVERAEVPETYPSGV